MATNFNLRGSEYQSRADAARQQKEEYKREQRRLDLQQQKFDSRPFATDPSGRYLNPPYEGYMTK